MLGKLTSYAIQFAEDGWLPDNCVRLGIQGLLRQRLRQSARGNSSQSNATHDFADRMRNSPLLESAVEANQQHYEVPAEFFRHILGKHMKYSCGFWESAATTLDQAEEAMLKLTCQRAAIEDGMRILELGCGWGSLSLWLADHFPRSQVVAVSNSNSQRKFIESQSKSRGLANLQVLTRNVAEFESTDLFDRILSVEMFEHFRNHAILLERISGWLTTTGKLFVHVFCHHQTPYCFEVNSPGDWMARHFFTGGIMPSAGLLNEYDEHLYVERQWNVNGTHYSQTCEAWLQNLDSVYNELLKLFTKDTDQATARLRLQRWRMFFLACSELFRFDNGNQWYVAHYVMGHNHQEGLQFLTERHPAIRTS